MKDKLKGMTAAIVAILAQASRPWSAVGSGW